MKLACSFLLIGLFFVLDAARAQTLKESVQEQVQQAGQEQVQKNEPSIEPAEAAPSMVEVSGTKDPDWKRYRAMLKGVDAFEKHHALAPQAEQKFILRPRHAGASRAGVTLRLAGNETSLPIAMAEDGSFVLPRDKQLQEEDAELLINRKKEMFRWWPYVRSPQLAPNQRRLGDLRLECEMFWAFKYDDAPFVARNVVRALGGPCTTKKVSINFPADYMGLKSATLVHGELRLVLPVDKKTSAFLAPLSDQKLSNDAIILLEYEEGADSTQKTNYSGLNVTAGF